MLAIAIIIIGLILIDLYATIHSHRREIEHLKFRVKELEDQELIEFTPD